MYTLYVCVCVCMYVCMYASMYEGAYVCINLKHTHTHTKRFAVLDSEVSMHVCMRVKAVEEEEGGYAQKAAIALLMGLVTTGFTRGFTRDLTTVLTTADLPGGCWGSSVPRLFFRSRSCHRREG